MAKHIWKPARRSFLDHSCPWFTHIGCSTSCWHGLMTLLISISWCLATNFDFLLFFTYRNWPPAVNLILWSSVRMMLINATSYQLMTNETIQLWYLWTPWTSQEWAGMSDLPFTASCFPAVWFPSQFGITTQNPIGIITLSGFICDSAHTQLAELRDSWTRIISSTIGISELPRSSFRQYTTNNAIHEPWIAEADWSTGKPLQLCQIEITPGEMSCFCKSSEERISVWILLGISWQFSCQDQGLSTCKFTECYSMINETIKKHVF